jgi:hypothetical protein
LCLAKAATEPPIRAAITATHEIAVFYSDSNKRLLDLQACIDEQCPESSHTRLKKHCDTRWVEKQSSILVFKELYPAVIVSLERITLWPGDAGGKAAMFVKSIQEASFLVSLEVLSTVLEVTKPLSQKLQGPSQDLHSASTCVTDCIDVLQQFRAGDVFNSRLFKQAEQVYGSPIAMPRVAGRQVHRSMFRQRPHLNITDEQYSTHT